MIVLNELSQNESLSNILNEQGDFCDLGCDAARAQEIKNKLEAENNEKRVRLIENWTVWDLNVNDEVTEALMAEGLKACVVYSTSILWDGPLIGSVGKRVRSKLRIVTIF